MKRKRADALQPGDIIRHCGTVAQVRVMSEYATITLYCPGQGGATMTWSETVGRRQIVGVIIPHHQQDRDQ